MKHFITLATLILSLNVGAQQMPGGGGMGGGSGSNSGPSMGDNSGMSGGTTEKIGVTMDQRQQACAQLFQDTYSQSVCLERFSFQIIDSTEYLMTLSMTASTASHMITCTVSVLNQPASHIKIAIPPASCSSQLL